MIIEKIAVTKYILDLTDFEGRQLTQVANRFHTGNRSLCLRKIFEGGLAVYLSLLQAEFDDEPEGERVSKLLADEFSGH